jgi:peptidylprolyl isomerase
MSKIKTGDKVTVHYSGTLEDGTVFDTTSGKAPFEFTMGDGEVISGFERVVEGMSAGDKQSVSLNPVDAFGEYHEDLVLEVPRTQLPEDIDPKIGMALQAKSPDGTVTRMNVTKVSDDSVTLDSNHPLAGKKVNFEIELVSIG